MSIQTAGGGAMIPLILEPLSKAATSYLPSCVRNHHRLRHQGFKKSTIGRVVLPRMYGWSRYEHGGSPQGCEASDL